MTLSVVGNISDPIIKNALMDFASSESESMNFYSARDIEKGIVAPGESRILVVAVNPYRHSNPDRIIDKVIEHLEFSEFEELIYLDTLRIGDGGDYYQWLKLCLLERMEKKFTVKPIAIPFVSDDLNSDAYFENQRYVTKALLLDALINRTAEPGLDGARKNSRKEKFIVYFCKKKFWKGFIKNKKINLLVKLIERIILSLTLKSNLSTCYLFVDDNQQY